MTSKSKMPCLAGVCVLFLLALSTCGFAATGVAGVDNGIAMVMDADTIGLANGTELTIWADQSGRGNDLHTWGWSHLNYAQYLTNQLNGHAAVRLRGPQDGDGYIDPMWTNTGALTGGSLTLFMVFNDRQTQWASDYPDYCQSVIASMGTMGYTESTTVGIWERSWDGTAFDPSLAAAVQLGNPWQACTSTAAFVPYQQYGVMVLQLNGASSFASLNGVVKATGNATGVSFAGDFMLGGMAGNASGRAAVIDVAEVVVYNRALSSTEENNVGSFLANKYGINTSYAHNKGIRGYVEDGAHNRVAGAMITVDGGAETATSDSAGNYTLEIYTGGPTYTIRAAKSGFADAVQSGVTVPGSGYTTLNLTLRSMASMSGQVKSSLPGNPPIAGANVVLMSQTDSDRTYTAKTDSAGNYSASVQANDTYQVEVSASGYKVYPDYSQMPSGVLIAFTANQTVHQDFTLTHSGTWSLTNDFSLAVNPNGQWSYGYYTETGDSQDPATNLFNLLNSGHLPFQSELAGWSASPPQGWPGNTFYYTIWLCKNTSSHPVEGVPTDLDYYVEQNALSFGGGDFNLSTPVIRWTAPDSGFVDLTFTIQSQVLNGKTHWTNYDGDSNSYVTLLKDQNAMAKKAVQGFIGRATNSFTDSIGPAPTTTFATTIAVVTGDTLDLALGQPHGALDHWNGNYGYPYASLDVYMAVSRNTNVHTASSVAQIKALNQGDIVVVTTPMQLCCASDGNSSFSKAYGNPTAGSDYCFYLMSDDRTQGIKCITDGTVPSYDMTNKITFTGKVDVQNGQKVVRVTSINSAVAGNEPKPLGKGAKALTNSNTLVRVWGKITQLVPNTGSDTDYYTYEYMVINDGSQDIKIPMHVQYAGISTYDAGIASLAVGHYVGVTGIAGTTTGSDVVVYPRQQSDIRDYAGL